MDTKLQIIFWKTNHVLQALCAGETVLFARLRLSGASWSERLT
jgi:hypothetical protein